MNRAAVASALVAGLAVAAAGCDTSPDPARATVPSASGAAGSLVATFGPPPTSGPPPSPSQPDDSGALILDPDLLDVLPVAIDGVPVQEDLDLAGEALLHPSLSDIASAVYTAVAVDTGSGNLVTAWVVRVRPGAFGEAAFRQWRSSYDDGACIAGGGIVGSAVGEIGGRETFITTCASAFRTYHVLLEDEDILVSATSLGPGRFGEKLMEGLRVGS